MRTWAVALKYFDEESKFQVRQHICIPAKSIGGAIRYAIQEQVREDAKPYPLKRSQIVEVDAWLE